VETLSVLAQAVMTAIELRQAVRRLEVQALTDSLTGLPNRQALLAALSRAIARQHRDGVGFALLYADLDGFKQVNDCFGHAEGDCALVTFAEAMQACLRTEDTAARLGGDEFAVLLQGNTAETGQIAERLRAATEAAMRAHGWPITASIGAVAFAEPPRDASAALAFADRHMYAAKQAGKNRVQAAATG
jgi:diguanylate cyclase (GGDEF)-like protein